MKRRLAMMLVGALGMLGFELLSSPANATVDTTVTQSARLCISNGVLDIGVCLNEL